ncbi:hypothetical protein KC219_28325, partial [Mycobacterium tuberculosis]|nr:hypothetical protein [Mycobacterium tuberculosis]
GVWLFLRGGPPTTPWHSLPQAIRTITELGASHKRVAVCTDDRDADDAPGDAVGAERALDHEDERAGDGARVDDEDD